MKKFEDLNPSIKNQVGECLRAAAYGPFFVDSNNAADPYWEIHSLFGLTIEELREVADTWPNSIKANTGLAIQNTLANLLGYPHGIIGEKWSPWISLTRAELQILLESLAQETT